MHSSNPIGTDISASIERSRLSVSIAENGPKHSSTPGSTRYRGSEHRGALRSIDADVVWGTPKTQRGTPSSEEEYVSGRTCRNALTQGECRSFSQIFLTIHLLSKCAKHDQNCTFRLKILRTETSRKCQYLRCSSGNRLTRRGMRDLGVNEADVLPLNYSRSGRS